MKNKFEIYPDNPKATNLSIASGATSIMCIVLIVIASILTLGILIVGYRYMVGLNLSFGLAYAIDEMDDEIMLTIVLWIGVVLLNYITTVLKEKIRVLVK